jgi:hypothetical protein
MILLTLNLRGVGGTLKVPPCADCCVRLILTLSSYRKLLWMNKKLEGCLCYPFVLAGYRVRLVLLELLEGYWLRGIQISLFESFYLLWRYSVVGYFLLENNSQINLLNVYGPCSERKDFWEQVATRGLLASNNLIVAGDLNLTTRADEIWGASTHLDKLVGFFKDLFQAHHLVDLLPDVLVPTWRNGRAGVTVLPKDWIVF